MERITKFAVDLPDPQAVDENSAYLAVATFTTYEEALVYLNQIYAMPPEVADFFITEY